MMIEGDRDHWQKPLEKKTRVEMSRVNIVPTNQLDLEQNISALQGDDPKEICYAQSDIAVGSASLSLTLGRLGRVFIGMGLSQSNEMQEACIQNIQANLKKWQKCLNRGGSSGEALRNVYNLSSMRPFHSSSLSFQQLIAQDMNVLAVGTEFQCSVWQVLTQIPMGQTVTYQWVADQVGSNGVRAVSSAIGSNPLALLIPCHRVVRKTGELGGYRWGLPIKKLLLDYERTLVK